MRIGSLSISIKHLYRLLATLTILYSLQGCAGSGFATADNVREYSVSFDNMKKIVGRAIGATNITIDNTTKSGDKYIINISRKTYTNVNTTQQEHGKVIITKLGENKSRVEVQDPEYEFSVPDQRREHYKRHIFNQIDAIVKKK